MKKLKLFCCIALLSIVSHTSVSAGGWNAGARLSTLGIQAEVAYLFNPTFALRLVGGGYEHFQPHLEYNGVHYHHIRYRPITVHLMADWYFLKEWWRLSVGIGYTGTKIRLKQDKRKDSHPANMLGVVTSKYKYKRKLAPYLGTGVDFPNIFGSRCIFSFDVGINFQGKVKNKVSATGQGHKNEALMDAAKSNANKLMNDAWWVKYYPVVSIGLKYPL